MGIIGLKVLDYPTIFQDNRGKYKELINSSIIDFNVRQVSCVDNKCNVVRGMHGDWGTSKIVTVLNGSVLQVCLDCRQSSDTYGEIFSTVLEAEDGVSVFIPPGVANGFRVLKDKSTYMYLQDTFYGEFQQFTVCPASVDLKGTFGDLKDCILSDRDQDRTKTLIMIQEDK